VKTLDLTVLAYDGPIVSAYLHQLRDAGYRPRRIVLLCLPLAGRRGRILERMVGCRLARKVIRRWKQFAGNQSNLPAELISLAQKLAGGSFNMVYRYEEFTDKLEVHHAETINDQSVIDFLRSNKEEKLYLFTGGGILRSPILSIPHVKFLHIHPGVVPHVRGSHCLLWSLLLRGCPGMSGFYMNSGIDTGKVVATEEYARPVFPKDAARRFGTDAIIRTLLQVYDPILRGRMLIKIVRDMEEQGESLENLPALPQDRSEGRTYYFMHGRVMEHLAEILCSGESPQSKLQD
jgi:hypothetical protein